MPTHLLDDFIEDRGFSFGGSIAFTNCHGFCCGLDGLTAAADMVSIELTKALELLLHVRLCVANGIAAGKSSWI